MEQEKYQVYYIEYDKDGKEIDRGVDSRKYCSIGKARNRAGQLRADKGKRYSDFQTIIAYRDPFTTYTIDEVCDICGKPYIKTVDHCDSTVDDHVSVWARTYDRDRLFSRTTVNKHTSCPECTSKILGLIESLGGNKK